eukprot:scaffold194327_cov56-Attheya_sp.AAC.2
MHGRPLRNSGRSGGWKDLHHTDQSGMNMKMESELAKSDIDNADMMSTQLEKVFNNHGSVDTSVLD